MHVDEYNNSARQSAIVPGSNKANNENKMRDFASQLYSTKAGTEKVQM